MRTKLFVRITIGVLVVNVLLSAPQKAFAQTSKPNIVLAYFEAIDKWASQQGVITYLFEAIDEPWKSNQNAQDPPWQGSNGAEVHYGFWYLDDQGQYMQKKV